MPTSAAESMPPPTAAPDRIAVTDGGAALALTFDGGETRLIAAARLRLACRCAHCTRARIDGRFPQSFDGVTIQAVTPMGHYAVNIGFSDGHARGIYPWAYLQELTDK